MRPRFGPANAWLFGERDSVLRELVEALSLNDADADEIFEWLSSTDFDEEFEREAVC
jgi:hypothetical protein